jgi:hypothetical protein
MELRVPIWHYDTREAIPIHVLLAREAIEKRDTSEPSKKIMRLMRNYVYVVRSSQQRPN